MVQIACTYLKLCAFWTAALSYEPTAADVHRFGLPFTPAWRPFGEVSEVRNAWRFTCVQAAYARKYPFEGRVAETFWRERVWDAVDDMADTGRCLEARNCAAVRLRELIGPVAYYRGEIPRPWTCE